jgi:TrmH family RNA methyltransferase
MVGGDI